MSYGVSTIQTFVEALQTNLQARIDAAEGAGVVKVWDGPPTSQGWAAQDWIMLGDVEGELTVPTMASSKQPRQEDYEVSVLLTCVRQTASIQKDVNDRAFALLDYLNQELRGNVSQGVTGVIAAVLGKKIAVVKAADDTQRECSITVGVHVKSRI